MFDLPAALYNDVQIQVIGYMRVNGSEAERHNARRRGFPHLEGRAAIH
jgi:hypothetical protein